MELIKLLIFIGWLIATAAVIMYGGYNLWIKNRSMNMWYFYAWLILFILLLVFNRQMIWE